MAENKEAAILSLSCLKGSEPVNRRRRRGRRKAGICVVSAAQYRHAGGGAHGFLLVAVGDCGYHHAQHGQQVGRATSVAVGDCGYHHA
jgi:hypothetical protein